ncbi:FadR family transcriptional regulator [Deinococcus detaillensis]|uniref:FadR family transcriptional regulator n=1 Tax=Deinococcus detaillensis TaxID=2592048 RepID=A0A553UPC6_9DEIO|nr:FadR/GntR family transcriptional regulator [Deinococcus detaillensis]TSA82073.1 FadR family transcriptional regulator [Deinococcus detaillensis]
MTVYPVKRQKIPQSVADELLALIVRCEMLPGQKLPPERVLAGQLGVSRASLRDALARLEVLGHIGVRQGEGTFVQQPDAATLCLPFQGLLTRLPPQARDLLAFRQMIEPEVAALAALHASAAQIAAINDCLERQETAKQSQQPLGAEDLVFHALIAQASGNSVVVAALNTLQHLLLHLRERLLVGTQPGLTVQQHRDIFEAIAARSPERARLTMSTHLDSVIRTAPDAYSSTGGSTHA